MHTNTLRLDGDSIRIDIGNGSERWVVRADHASFEPLKSTLRHALLVRGEELGLTDSRLRRLLLRAARAGLASSAPADAAS